jgi:hypothetical protein
LRDYTQHDDAARFGLADFGVIIRLSIGQLSVVSWQLAVVRGIKPAALAGCR